MGKNWKNLVVYSVRTKRKVIYVGQGSMSHALELRFHSRYKRFGLQRKPMIRIEQVNLTREEALLIEADLIAEFHPPKNKARYSSTGGLKTWNFGLRGDRRCRGGRPPGIPMTSAAKKKLSEAMKGRASRWMTGRSPWNKNLTSADLRVAQGIAAYTAERRKRAAALTWQKRRQAARLSTRLP